MGMHASAPPGNGTYEEADALEGLVLPFFMLPATATTAALGAGVARFVRVTRGGTISKIALHVGTSTGNISVGVWTNEGSGQSAKPKDRIATSGAVACPAVGYAEVSLGASVDVPTGYWLGVTASAASAIAGRDFSANVWTAASMAALVRTIAASAHPGPADASAAVASTVQPHLFGVA